MAPRVSAKRSIDLVLTRHLRRGLIMIVLDHIKCEEEVFQAMNLLNKVVEPSFDLSTLAGSIGAR